MKKLTVIFSALLFICLGSAAAQTQLVKDLKKGESRTLVVYGTSIAKLGHGPLWVDMIGTELNEKYSGHLTVLNRGGSGRNSQWGANNLADSVLSAKPDAVIIEFSVNDAVDRFDISPEQSIKNTDWMIRKIKEQNPSAEVILLVVSTNPVGEAAVKRPDLAKYIAGYHKMAKDNKLQIIDMGPIWKKMIEDKGEKEMRRYLHDGVHSSAKGATEMIGPTVIKALETGK